MTSMDLPLFHPLNNPQTLELHCSGAVTAEFQGKPALRLENGLALLPDFSGQDLSIEVWIAAEGPSYSGLVFRLADSDNYELAYAQPHSSGSWDALQYDPVFHHSNTWQVYHGPAYQYPAVVPTGRWFRLSLDVIGTRAAVSVDDQPPLVVERLAYRPAPGRVGIWTYLPAYFRDLRVFPCRGISDTGEAPRFLDDTVENWQLQGIGEVTVEPNGALNLNRWLPVSASPAHLAHRFSLPQAQPVDFAFGFSDELSLAIDEQPIFHGENLWQGMETGYDAHGYVIAGQHHASLWLEAGEHELTAALSASEGFGWGIICQILQ